MNSEMLNEVPIEALESFIRTFFIAFIIVNCLGFIIAGVAAHKKGRSVIGALLLTAFLGLIGFIIVLCLSNKRKVSHSSYASTPSRTATPSPQSSHSTAGHSSSATPTPTFGRGSSTTSTPSSSSTPSSGSSSKFASAIGSTSSGSKKGFGIKMCPHCGSAVSSRHCAMCGKDNTLF